MPILSVLGSAKTVAVSAEEDSVVIPPPKPPRRTNSVAMKNAITPSSNKTSIRNSDPDCIQINVVQTE